MRIKNEMKKKKKMIDIARYHKKKTKIKSFSEENLKPLLQEGREGFWTFPVVCLLLVPSAPAGLNALHTIPTFNDSEEGSIWQYFGNRRKC